MNTFPLTSEMEAAYTDIVKFINSPTQVEHVLEGYSGTGKTTFLCHLLKDLSNVFRTAKLINPDFKFLDLRLCSTTQKASEVLTDITGHFSQTYHSLFGFRPLKNHLTGKSTLIRSSQEKLKNSFIVIDECSQITDEDLSEIYKNTKNCKILFVGDPCQTIHHEKTFADVFTKGFKTSKLTKLLRQGDDPHHPIALLAMGFRETVLTGEWPRITIDNKFICKLSRDPFEEYILSKFKDKSSKTLDQINKYLAWSNGRVIDYNKAFNKALRGSSSFEVGDYVICNSYINTPLCKLGTDQQVRITKIKQATSYNLKGHMFTLDEKNRAFMPESRKEWEALIQHYKNHKDQNKLNEISNSWIDLRFQYGCTINKAQGSTYTEVYIDLQDISRCRNYNQIARMLYVATSRPTDKIIFTGELK